MNEGYEIDFLSSCGGQAIAVRYGIPRNYRVMVYDGTTRQAGEDLVEHVRRRYGTNHVDYVVCPHSDAGRASALSVVLENMSVGQLWMHRPWDYSDEVLRYFTDPRPGDDKRLKENLEAIFGLEEQAATKRVRVFEPFRGAQIGAFHVASPAQNWYVDSLLPDAGTLLEDAGPSPDNEGCVVLVGEIGARKVLLTSDAGIGALTTTVDYAESVGVSFPRTLDFIQVPNHGSGSVSPDLLDRLIGPECESPPGEARLTAFVSAEVTQETLRDKELIDALLRRGAKVVAAAQGQRIRHEFNMVSGGDDAL